VAEPQSKRIAAVDAARGVAMVLSCLAHFAWWIQLTYSSAAGYLSTVAKIATPSFLLISGAMAGLLSQSSRLDILRRRLLLRGLFLLTGGHALVSLAEAHRDGGFIHTLGSATIVDDIGLATTLAAIAIPLLAPPQVRTRIAVASGIAFIAIWVVVLGWTPPHLSAGATLEAALFGGSPSDGEPFSYSGPTLQYIAIYALGLPLGSLLGKVRHSDLSGRTFERMLLGVALALFSCTILLKGLRYVCAAVWKAPPEWLLVTSEIGQKHPPSPAYLAFYAACSLVILAGLSYAARRDSVFLQYLVRWFSVLGRASLFIFIVQYFLYWTLPDLLGITPGPTAPLVFVCNIGIAWILAKLWTFANGRLKSVRVHGGLISWNRS